MTKSNKILERAGTTRVSQISTAIQQVSNISYTAESEWTVSSNQHVPKLRYSFSCSHIRFQTKRYMNDLNGKKMKKEAGISFNSHPIKCKQKNQELLRECPKKSQFIAGFGVSIWAVKHGQTIFLFYEIQPRSLALPPNFGSQRPLPTWVATAGHPQKTEMMAALGSWSSRNTSSSVAQINFIWLISITWVMFPKTRMFSRKS